MMFGVKEVHMSTPCILPSLISSSPPPLSSSIQMDALFNNYYPGEEYTSTHPLYVNLDEL